MRISLKLVNLTLLLAAIWLLWSGLYKPLIIVLGAVSCLLTVWIVSRMDFFDNQFYALRFNFRLIRYWFWLLIELIKSSLEVARIVLKPKMDINPVKIEIEAISKTAFDQMMLGNSITLTPGTLTLDVHEGRLIVHALTEEGARALQEGEMNRRVAALRGKV